MQPAANRRYLPLNPLFAAAGWYPVEPVVLPTSVVKPGSLARFVNITGLVRDETRLAQELALIYPSAAIMTSGQGHVALGFSAAGSLERANAATTGRLAGDAAGTTAAPALYTASSTAYNPPGDPGAANGQRPHGALPRGAVFSHGSRDGHRRVGPPRSGCG